MTTSKLPSLIGIRSILKVLGEMAHLVSDSIRPEGFLSSVLLWLVIIVGVVGVSVTVVVVIESSFVVKLSFVITSYWHRSWAKEIHQNRASSVKVPVSNFTLQSSVQLLRENTDSVRSNQRIRPTAPSISLKLIAFAIVTACASRAAISNPEASQSNLAIISHLLSLKFSNLSTRLSEFSFQIVKILLYDHPAISKKPLLLSSYMLKRTLSKVEGCGGLGGSRLTTSDKEVTKQDLVLKGGDRGTFKLLGDVMVILEWW
ncbi:hypothetical protein Tco_1137210 [Tanacetum coccineum]